MINLLFTDEFIIYNFNLHHIKLNLHNILNYNKLALNEL